MAHTQPLRKGHPPAGAGATVGGAAPRARATEGNTRELFPRPRSSARPDGGTGPDRYLVGGTAHGTEGYAVADVEQAASRGRHFRGTA
jgi:hypothetical protein